MKKTLFALVVVAQLFAGFTVYAKPKYGPEGSPYAVSLALSNEYFRNPKHPAPAFWSLIPYYIPQFTGASCSSAALTMVLNAARAHLPQTSDDAVITEKMILDKVDIDHYKDRLTSKIGHLGQFGADLDLLGKVTDAAFKAYGFPRVSLKVVHVNSNTKEAKTELVKALKSLSLKTFVIANFDQKKFTDDVEVGHFAPVGAYDEELDRVLVLDPDRAYFAPYWVSTNTFLEGMATLDSSKKTYRGYIVVTSEP